jgi:lipase chaperone LimK
MSTSLSAEEKKRILKALEEDEEFRYAVAGLIGISEILKRLDKLANQEKLWLEEV